MTTSAPNDTGVAPGAFAPGVMCNHFPGQLDCGWCRANTEHSQRVTETLARRAAKERAQQDAA